MRFLVFISFSLMAFFFSSCGPDYILDQTYEIENQAWTYSDTLNFDIDVQDSTKIYNLIIEVEHSVEFSNQNMYVMIHTAFPSGQRLGHGRCSRF